MCEPGSAERDTVALLVPEATEGRDERIGKCVETNGEKARHVIGNGHGGAGVGDGDGMVHIFDIC